MPELSRDLRLPMKPLEEDTPFRLIEGKPQADHLDSDGPIHHGIVRSVHHPHVAATDLFQELVTGKCVNGHFVSLPW
jgi:hypothetical protein